MMQPQGVRLTIRHHGDHTAFVRVLATVVNPTPLYLSSTARQDGEISVTLMLRNRRATVDGLLVHDVLARVGARYDWSDVELVTETGSPVEIEPGVMTAA